MRKKVVIVGAGPSGLVALKEMVEAGHEAVAIEKSHVLGGVFSTLADSCYDGLYLTISNVFMAYSDFPCQEDYIKYSKKEEYARYLEAYAAHFRLEEKIRFQTTVERATLDASTKKWTVTLRRDSEISTLTDVDSVVVCTGSNQTPKKTPENVQKFRGPVIHSSEFQNRLSYENQKVMIVGVGESAADIASEISEVAAQTTVWSRRPFIVAPRYMQIAMTTKNFDEFKVMGDETMWSQCKLGDFLETGSTSRASNIGPTWIYAMIRHVAWRAMATDPTNASLSMLGKLCEYSTNFPGVDAKTYFKADQAGWVTKNSRLMQMLADGSVELVVSHKAEMEGTSCTFPDVLIHNDNEFFNKEKPTLKRDFDVVVCCTGYQNDFAWLDAKGDWCPRTWYKHCWPAGYEKGELAFIGWARPHQGGIPQTAELCARFHALLLKEERTLPDNLEALIQKEAEAETAYYVLSPNLTSLVDWPAYAHSLARMIGCEPRTPWFLFGPVTWFKYWLYPLWPCWYRLRGPGANPEAFWKVMDRFPLLQSKILVDPIIMFIVFPWSVAQKFLINLLCFPLTWGFPGSAKLLDMFSKSKLNVLHGNRLRLRDLVTFST